MTATATPAAALPAPLAAALDRYRVEYLAARNLAPKTREEYTRDLTQLCSFLATEARVTHPDALAKQHVERFLATLDARGLTGATRRRKVAAIRSFCAFLTDAGLTQQNLALRLAPPAREEEERRVLSEAEYKRLLDSVADHARDAAILELFLQTGLRRAEVAGLTRADVTLPAKIVRPNPQKGEPGTVGSAQVRGKGRKQRTVTLNYKACRALKRYQGERPAAESEALFLTKYRKPLGVRALDELAQKWLREAGIAGATLHSLRHTFATHQLRRGTKLSIIQQALGHEDPKTTAIYVHLAREEMDRELQAGAL